MAEGKVAPDLVPVAPPFALAAKKPPSSHMRPTSPPAENAGSLPVGAAFANFFPRVGLTSLYGGQSSEIENLVKGTGNVRAIPWSLALP